MLEKYIVPYFRKLLIVGSLKGLYGSSIDSVAFGIRGKKSNFVSLFNTVSFVNLMEGPRN
jgi:hypothetical protein